MSASGPVLTFDFQNFDRARSSIARAIAELPNATQAEMQIGVNNAVIELGVEALQEVTPYRTGNLSRSTVGHMEVDGNVFTAAFEQPAVNTAGDEYAKYVIQGHYTKGGTLVPPNPYPQEAMDIMRSRVNQVLSETARRIAERTINAMGQGA